MPMGNSLLKLSKCLLPAALAAIFAFPLPALPAPPKMGITGPTTWDLSQGKVISPGTASQTPKGLRVTGYVVQAAAQAQGEAPVNAGVFTITCTIFSPAQDTARHKAGTYYLRGAWNIAKEGARPATRHTPDSVKGFLAAELPFDPRIAAGTIQAQFFSGPMRRHGSKADKATGVFTGNEKFEGTLAISNW